MVNREIYLKDPTLHKLVNKGGDSGNEGNRINGHHLSLERKARRK
jgi:hypothetical protein